MLKIRNFIIKLRNLPDDKKKIAFISFMVAPVLIAIFLGVILTKNNIARIGDSLKNINLPDLTSDIKTPQDAMKGLPSISDIENSLNQAALDENLQTADWKTYTNAEYGFQLEYPANWGIVSGENRTDGEFAFCGINYPNSDCLPVFSIIVPEKNRGISLYILNANKVQAKYGIGNVPGIWVDNKNNYLYELVYTDYSNNIPGRDVDLLRQDAINHMITTFKFTSIK